MNLDPPILDNFDCTPHTKSQMTTVKRKASQAIEQGPPTTPKPSLGWRLSIVESMLKVSEAQRIALSELSEADEFFNEWDTRRQSS